MASPQNTSELVTCKLFNIEAHRARSSCTIMYARAIWSDLSILPDAAISNTYVPSANQCRRRCHPTPRRANRSPSVSSRPCQWRRRKARNLRKPRRRGRYGCRTTNALSTSPTSTKLEWLMDQRHHHCEALSLRRQRVPRPPRRSRSGSRRLAGHVLLGRPFAGPRGTTTLSAAGESYVLEPERVHARGGHCSHIGERVHHVLRLPDRRRTRALP